jgi:hypothetical protein
MDKCSPACTYSDQNERHRHDSFTPFHRASRQVLTRVIKNGFMGKKHSQGDCLSRGLGQSIQPDWRCSIFLFYMPYQPMPTYIVFEISNKRKRQLRPPYPSPPGTTLAISLGRQTDTFIHPFHFFPASGKKQPKEGNLPHTSNLHKCCPREFLFLNGQGLAFEIPRETLPFLIRPIHPVSNEITAQMPAVFGAIYV